VEDQTDAFLNADLKEKPLTRSSSLKRIVFNIVVGQLIAIGLVSGGIFT
jgi:hypothetical protein